MIQKFKSYYYNYDKNFMTYSPYFMDYILTNSFAARDYMIQILRDIKFGLKLTLRAAQKTYADDKSTLVFLY